MVTRNSEAETSNPEIVLERVFDAPREMVFDAWTSPEHVSQWFGPRGFTMTIHEMDARPGGVFRFIFHGPDGTDYNNKIVYNEITRPERIVYTHGEDNDGPGDFVVTATFTEQGKGTKITMRMLFPTTEARDKTIEFGAIEGANQTMERLAEYLARRK